MVGAPTNVIWSPINPVGKDNTQKTESKHINLRPLSYDALPGSVSSRLRILPTGLFGISEMNATCRGTL